MVARGVARPRCSVFIAISLDGFIARADGGIDWLTTVERPGEDYGFGAFFGAVDTLVLGRKTYETALGFDAWPYAGKRVVVLTRDPSRAPRHGEELTSSELPALLERLGDQGARHVYLDGGVTIGRALAAGVVDELTVSIIPVLLGEGLPLAPHVGRDAGLTLLEHRAFPSGLVQLRYRVSATGTASSAAG